jgi:hypothetical protein
MAIVLVIGKHDLLVASCATHVAGCWLLVVFDPTQPSSKPHKHIPFAGFNQRALHPAQSAGTSNQQREPQTSY